MYTNESRLSRNYSLKVVRNSGIFQTSSRRSLLYRLSKCPFVEVIGRISSLVYGSVKGVIGATTIKEILFDGPFIIGVFLVIKCSLGKIETRAVISIYYEQSRNALVETPVIPGICYGTHYPVSEFYGGVCTKPRCDPVWFLRSL
jgi:hypothetical protein